MTKFSGEIIIREYSEPPGSKHAQYREFALVDNQIRSLDESLFHLRSTVITSISSISRSLQDVFLPVGFPQTVGPGYWEYQLYDSLQGICSYLRGVVSSAHVLHAAGVGNREATAWSAALTWALKDGMGMMGGLVFSSWAAPLFDSYVKEFRLFADLINNLGLTLDMLSPLVPSHLFLWVAAASTLCKTMCGMSAGATKGSITQHFAVAGNLADLLAKEGTQETLVSLIGMTFGIALARYFQNLEETVNAHPESAGTAWKIQWIVFGFLTCLHVWANYRAVRGLKLRSLNRQRAECVLRPLVKRLCNDQPVPEKRKSVMKILDLIVGPQDVQESLAVSTYHMLWPSRWSKLILGCPLTQLLATDIGTGQAKDVLELFRDNDYVLWPSRNGQILVTLLAQACRETEIRAFFHALLIREILPVPAASGDTFFDIVKRTYMWVQWFFDIKDDESEVTLYSRLQEKGWDIQERVYIGFTKSRSSWMNTKSE
ncbi:hypothetical protein FisN_23Hh105 [Fistulifera solaris]|uniref:DUF647 domain-containing protein n=1 Tax=Fistulifera solaris TaxID=1519565 RepID=A0A1Z5KN47_FISSO|nr:hypothetical protein FisN_23Hh105 [Fistulifera solaris]|eukprot:GAX27431.1 hypothetical protein FisN_23Hh105 [Fistulifera solaris]